MLNKIYNQINGITTAVKENNYRISKLEETIGQLKTSDRIINNEPTWDFPIKNLEELDLFEDKLLNEHFKSNIVSCLSYTTLYLVYLIIHDQYIIICYRFWK